MTKCPKEAYLLEKEGREEGGEGGRKKERNSERKRKEGEKEGRERKSTKQAPGSYSKAKNVLKTTC